MDGTKIIYDVAWQADLIFLASLLDVCMCVCVCASVTGTRKCKQNVCIHIHLFSSSSMLESRGTFIASWISSKHPSNENHNRVFHYAAKLIRINLFFQQQQQRSERLPEAHTPYIRWKGKRTQREIIEWMRYRSRKKEKNALTHTDKTQIRRNTTHS